MANYLQLWVRADDVRELQAEARRDVSRLLNQQIQELWESNGRLMAEVGRLKRRIEDIDDDLHKRNRTREMNLTDFTMALNHLDNGSPMKGLGPASPQKIPETPPSKRVPKKRPRVRK